MFFSDTKTNENCGMKLEQIFRVTPDVPLPKWKQYHKFYSIDINFILQSIKCLEISAGKYGLGNYITKSNREWNNKNYGSNYFRYLIKINEQAHQTN